MRPLVSGRPLVLATASAVLLLTGGVLPAVADDAPTPTQAEVEAADAAASDKERTVAAVQADLVMAGERAQAASIAAARAAEDYNVARWELDEARREVKAADKQADEARRSLREQQVAYGAMLAATYEMSPSVTALSALADEDGVQGVVETSNTMYGLTSSMETVKQAYQAAATVADLATSQAERARAAAAELEEQAAGARNAAHAMEARAVGEAEAVSRERDVLIAELAELQGISVNLAAQRQAGLEQAARERAAAAAEAEAIAASASDTETVAPAAQPAAQPDGEPAADPQPAPDPRPEPDPEPAPDPEPEPDPTPPPPSTSGAQRAISFARAQIGERYVWGADGPSSWDCSGLTMKAWQQGGKYLSHSSRYQYRESTPISRSQLRPGDLLFWTDGGASGIYHVALYTGDGMMVHAPNSNRRVVEESMYIWPPQMYARP